jgi:hypothetical protein
MHNNGLFIPPNGKDQTIHFEGNDFKFKVNKPIDFVNTELIVSLTGKMIFLVVKIVTADEIKEKEFIVDETAKK